MEEQVIKFTEAEMLAIAQLQSKYQQKIFELGQIELTKVDLEQQLQDNAKQRDQMFEDWKKIQTEENNLLQQLSQKYGDGTLSLKDGTFKPIKK